MDEQGNNIDVRMQRGSLQQVDESKRGAAMDLDIDIEPRRRGSDDGNDSDVDDGNDGADRTVNGSMGGLSSEVRGW